MNSNLLFFNEWMPGRYLFELNGPVFLVFLIWNVCFGLIIVFCVNLLSNILKLYRTHSPEKKRQVWPSGQVSSTACNEWTDLDSIFIPNTGRIVPTKNNLRSKVPIQKVIEIFLLPLKSIPVTNLHDFVDLVSGSYSVVPGVKHQCNHL